MTSVLMHHQLLGASFMRDRELNPVDEPHGGLLADEMGFGKTLMMITTMVTNSLPPGTKSRSTLIVCPRALIPQWRREIAKHASPGIFSEVIDYSPNPMVNRAGCEMVVENPDVVLATYEQVAKSYPLAKPPQDLSTDEEKQDWLEKHWGDKLGLLHRAQFHRVVLDESHAIKNYKARASIACQALKARYRWALSGTPIMNSVEELYPYFKFLLVPLAGDLRSFKEKLCGEGDATERLHEYLLQFMLRRTHMYRLFGKPIIKLPECHLETIELYPTTVEKFVYQAVGSHYVRAVNYVARTGTEQEIKQAVLIRFLRLRQMTAHLFLVQHVLQTIFDLSDVNSLNDHVRDDTDSQEILKAFHELILHRDEYEISDEEDENSVSIGRTDQSPQLPQAPSLSKEFLKYLGSLIANGNTIEFKKRSTCVRCGEPPEDPHVTSCMHVYCEACLHAMACQAAGEDYRTQCLECATIYTSAERCEGIKEMIFKAARIPGISDMQGMENHKQPKDVLRWIRTEKGTILSRKASAVIAVVEKWLSEEPDKKIIIFSQWSMM